MRPYPYVFPGPHVLPAKSTTEVVLIFCPLRVLLKQNYYLLLLVNVATHDMHKPFCRYK